MTHFPACAQQFSISAFAGLMRSPETVYIGEQAPAFAQALDCGLRRKDDYNCPFHDLVDGEIRSVTTFFRRRPESRAIAKA